MVRVWLFVVAVNAVIAEASEYFVVIRIREPEFISN